MAGELLVSIVFNVGVFNDEPSDAGVCRDCPYEDCHSRERGFK
jgi:hypothetical protein